MIWFWDKRTSREWQKRCNTTVIDPDGWDRKNLDYSWNKERITKKEFEHRLAQSTCMFPSPFPKDIWDKVG